MKTYYKEDKVYLKALCEVLEISERNLKRDECDNCVLVGRRGIINTDTENWYLYVSTTARKWNNIKKQFTWMDVTQDGDEEGMLRSNLCMSRKQAAEIRKLAGLTHTPGMSDKQRENVARMRKALVEKGVSASSIDLNEQRVDM